MKKIISIISSFVLTASLWSCGKKTASIPVLQTGNQETISSGQTVDETGYKLTSYFESVRMADEDKFKGHIYDMAAGGGNIYLISDYSADYSTTGDDMLQTVYRETDTETMQTVKIKKSTDRSEEKKDYYNPLYCMEELNSIPEIKKLSADTCYGELKSSSGDNYYVLSKKYDSPYLVKTDSNGNLVYISDRISEIEEGYQVFGMAETPEGKIVIASFRYRGIVTVFDPETGYLEEITEINGIDWIYGFAGDRLVCSDNKGVYGYSFEDESMITYDTSDEGFNLYDVSVERGKITAEFLEIPKYKQCIYCTDMEGRIINSAEFEVDYGNGIQNTFVDKNGDLCFILYSYGMDSEEGESFETSKTDIYRFGPDGSLEKIYDSPVIRCESHVYGFLCDADGNIILCRDDRNEYNEYVDVTEVFSSSGEKLLYEINDDFVDYYRMGNRLIARMNSEIDCYKDVVFEDGSLKYNDSEYSFEDYFYLKSVIPCSEKFDYCTSDENGLIKGYRFDDGSCTEIMNNWSECDEELSGKKIVLDEDTLLALAYDFDEKKYADDEYYFPETYPVFLKRADAERLKVLNSRKY